jgi:murein DD-endopeptidase MepM/ murein hydrolase activator NlpD
MTLSDRIRRRWLMPLIALLIALQPVPVTHADARAGAQVDGDGGFGGSPPNSAGSGKPDTARTGAASGRAWPVDGGTGRARPVVLRGFEPPATTWGPGHRGVDLASGPGAVVRAAAPGLVAFAGSVGGRGVLSIELAATGTPPLHTTYEPVDPIVAVGDQVTAGEPVATVQGSASHCPMACVHWGLLRGPVYLDPLTLLPPWMRRAGHPRLLPLLDEPPQGAPRTPPPALVLAGALLPAAGSRRERR